LPKDGPTGERRTTVNNLPHHRFHKHLREWFRLLWEVSLITEQEFKAACEKELAEELEENPEAE
jgi:hypothetical protein